MNGILKGVRPSDYLLALLFTATGAMLMYLNITGGDDDSLAHPLSTTSWAILPTFVFVTLPILWRRRNIVAVIGVTTVITLGHVLAFGWLTRCGVLLPLSVAMTYAVARFARSRTEHLVGLAGTVLFLVTVLWQDSSTGGLPGGLEVALPAAAVFYGIGLVVQNRVTRKQQQQGPVVEHATV